jgi:hypothetical protein
MGSGPPAAIRCRPFDPRCALAALFTGLLSSEPVGVLGAQTRSVLLPRGSRSAGLVDASLEHVDVQQRSTATAAGFGGSLRTSADCKGFAVLLWY